MIAAIPLVLLIVSLTWWTGIHFDLVIGLVASTGVMGAVVAFWSFLPDDTTAGARLGFARALASRRLFKVFMIVLGVFLIGTLFVTSARVTAQEISGVVWIYRLHPSQGSTGDAAMDSARLDAQHLKRAFYIVDVPRGKPVMLLASDGSFTTRGRAWPWRGYHKMYPEDFDSAATIAVLPMGNLMTYPRAGAPLRFVVRSAGDANEVIAESILPTINAIILSSHRPRAVDVQTRRRWSQLLVDSLSTPDERVDTMDVAPLVDRWMKSQWIRTNRPLQRGSTLEIVLLETSGDTLAATKVSLAQATSDVILKKRQ